MADRKQQLINGRYEILSDLGTGGMAQVFLAKDRRFRREVVVKMLHQQLLNSPEAREVREQFRIEAALMLRLKHPNIVTIYEYGEYKGRPFMVLEPLTNNSLSRRMAEFGDHERAAKLLATIADALGHMHKRRIVHCDVKPDNILFDEHDRPKLTDFGVAQLLPNEYQNGHNDEPFTTPFLQGTPQYMSPEQWQNTLSPQSDQYALGVVLFELLTREWPFSDTSALETGDAHLYQRVPRPTEIVKDLPEAVDTVVLRMLAKKPEQRYANMAETAQALRELAKVPLSDGERKRRKAVDQHRNRKRWRWWLLASIGILIVAAVAAVIIWQVL
ncbi:MAG: serine/threonine-protein kinase [Anaerolineae bacterium]|jgi:serine/threonine-protein kinase|nr:serine/threonine-protein kinase [Anaerolineae bacterium]